MLPVWPAPPPLEGGPLGVPDGAITALQLAGVATTPNGWLHRKESPTVLFEIFTVYIYIYLYMHVQNMLYNTIYIYEIYCTTLLEAYGGLKSPLRS